MLPNRTPADANATTTERVDNVVVNVRHLVLPDRRQALGLTIASIAASTYGDIIGQPPETIAGWLGAERAVVIDDGSRLAQAAITKLQSSQLPTVVVHEDRGAS